MGSERTLVTDISREADIKLHLRRAADRIARRLRRKAYVAGGVRLRLKTSDFQVLTRQCSLATPTDTADVLFATACSLLQRREHPGPFRLVGLAAHSLQPRSEAAQLGLFDDAGKNRKLEIALDQLAERYGDNVLQRARDISRTMVNDVAPNLDFIDS